MSKISKFTFYKKWTPKDIQDIRAGKLTVKLSYEIRLCDLAEPTERENKLFIECLEDVRRRNVYLQSLRQPLLNTDFCKTDLETYSLENAMQCLRKLYSGYAYYEVSTIFKASESKYAVCEYDIFDNKGRFVGVVQESKVESKVGHGI